MQYSVSIRNARLEAIQQTIGPSPICRIYAGATPKNCEEAAGKSLVTMKLPGHWLKTVNAVASSGPWSAEAEGSGDASYFRIESKSGCIQGTVGGRDSAADLKLSTKSAELVEGQTVTVESFALKSGNG